MSRSRSYINSISDRIFWLVRLLVFLSLVTLAIGIYRYLLIDIFDGGAPVGAFVLLWLFSAYIILPRLHRRLTKLYLPNYFIGRVRTGDGLLGDPVNLAVIGSGEQLVKAMEAAGWTLAEELSWRTSLKMMRASIQGRSYLNAPVSSLYLFSRPQQYAFEIEINGNPRKRHHVRFWPTPKGWWLPGGYKADWLGAATLDKHVGLSLLTGQITHKIDADIDKERDFVVKSLVQAKVTDKVTVVEHFASAFRDRNGGGDQIHTDGSLPFLVLAGFPGDIGKKRSK